jgi:hypothetical protein
MAALFKGLFEGFRPYAEATTASAAASHRSESRPRRVPTGRGEGASEGAMFQ